MNATLGFPTILKFNIADLRHLDEERLMALAYQHCIHSGIRPRVIRYIVSENPNDKAVDIQWKQMVKYLGLSGLDLALAEPICGSKTKDIDLTETAKHYGLKTRDIRARIYQEISNEDETEGYPNGSDLADTDQ